MHTFLVPLKNQLVSDNLISERGKAGWHYPRPCSGYRAGCAKIEPDVEFNDIEAVLSPGIAVSGKVVDPSGVGVGNAFMRFRSVDNGMTAADGSFRISNVNPGRSMSLFRPKGFSTCPRRLKSIPSRDLLNSLSRRQDLTSSPGKRKMISKSRFPM